MLLLCPDHVILFGSITVITFGAEHTLCSPRYAAVSDLLLFSLSRSEHSSQHIALKYFHFIFTLKISHLYKITTVLIGQNRTSFLTLSQVFRWQLSSHRVYITYLIHLTTHFLPEEGGNIFHRNVDNYESTCVTIERIINCIIIAMRTSELLYRTFKIFLMIF